MGMQGEMSSQFFRVILPHILEDEILELPRPFVKKHGKHLSKHAVLILPTGKESEMELKRGEEDQAWLHKGWRDFVDECSIRLGYFLVFSYQGDGSSFNVFIYDLSATEIDYPLRSAGTGKKTAEKCKLTHVEEEDSEDHDVKVEIPDESPQKVQKGKEKQKVKESRKLKTGQTSFAMKNKLKGSAQVIEDRGLDTMNARDRALERAKAFQSQNPYFTIIMKPTYVAENCYLHIPGSAGHIISYFHTTVHNNIKLKTNGRVWVVNYVTGSSKHQVRLCVGWSTFSRENFLQEGDVCVFELVNTQAMTFKVTIFRLNDEQVERTVHIASSSRSSAMKKVESFKSKNPYFKIYMNRSYLSSLARVHIPIDHSSVYLNADNHDDNVINLHGPNGKIWRLHYHCSTKRSLVSMYGKAWQDFLSDNHIRVGDVCVFEMIKGNAKAYKITIFPAEDHA